MGSPRSSVVHAHVAPAPRYVTPALIAIVIVAFGLRVAVRLWSGEAAFMNQGYTFYLRIAEHFVQGHGLCLGFTTTCAQRMPLYPLLLVPFVWAGGVYPWLPILQAACGAGLVWAVFAVGRRLFDSGTGLVAAGIAACSPYAVVHDTALQDTALVNLLMMVTVYWLLRVRGSWAHALAAGAVLGLAVLTTARVALMAPAALVWVLLAGVDPWRVRLGRAVLVSVPLACLAGGWMARNWITVGAPVLTTESGASLWDGNNEWTFSSFPAGTIDDSVQAAWRALDPERRAAINALETEPARDRLQAAWARAYIREHPWRTLWAGIRKNWVTASAQLSPSRGPWADLLYRLLYGPLHVLAAIGLWRARRRAHAHWLIFAMIAAYAVTTALFWAHTSHASLLDGLLFIYAASAALRFRRPAGRVLAALA
jgi:4-amino-4-deoxy-L-arabinose transferase-like glycosyltransferase